MDLRNMRQLLAVRSHGSLAKAAPALGMSQPSLSAAIARLEDQLRVRLFDRSSQGSQLTPIGELIAERAAKLIGEADQIVRDAALVAGGEAGAIRVGIGTALRHNFLPRFVVALAEAYPALTMTFEVLDRDRLVPLVKSRDLDLVICAVHDDVVEANLAMTEVLTTHPIAVARRDHALVREPSVSVERFCQFASAGATAKEFTNADILRVTGDEPRLMQYQSNDSAPLLELALRGAATLIAPVFIVQPYLEAGNLCRVAIDIDFPISFAAIASRAASFSPVVSKILRQAATLGATLHQEELSLVS